MINVQLVIGNCGLIGHSDLVIGNFLVSAFFMRFAIAGKVFVGFIRIAVHIAGVVFASGEIQVMPLPQPFMVKAPAQC